MPALAVSSSTCRDETDPRGEVQFYFRHRLECWSVHGPPWHVVLGAVSVLVLCVREHS